jgi:hypothetical protein
VAEKPIKKYSNPASSKFTFELTGKVENNAQIKLYDANRKVIRELKITQAKTNFNIDTLPDTRYIIEIINGNYAEMFNFTKNEAKVTKNLSSKENLNDKSITFSLNADKTKLTIELTTPISNNAKIEVREPKKDVKVYKITNAKTEIEIDTLFAHICVRNGNNSVTKTLSKGVLREVHVSKSTSNSNAKVNTTKSLTLDTKTTEKVEDASIKIYPNPNDGKFAVEISGSIDTNAKIQIYTIKGELVKELNVSQAKTEINLDSAKGSYLVKVTNGTKIVSKNIVKQ